MINIVLFGAPGSGKGTQAKFLEQKFNLKQISTGDLFREHISQKTDLGILAESYIKKGHLVPDDVTIQLLQTALEKETDGQGYIFDGFPRTRAQAEALDILVNSTFNSKINICLALKVEDEELIKRLLKRGESSGRADDANENIIRERLAEYYAKTADVAEYYKNQGNYVEILGKGSIEEITEQLSEAIEKNL